MNKTVIMICVTIFGLIGSYLPILIWHFDIFSIWGILGGMIGGFFGIWVGVKLSQRFGE